MREGGCILADEVGLGKTIEAGLVIAQLRAEGARRVLLVAPKALLGQWRQELYSLFGIVVRDSAARSGDFDGSGVFLIGREVLGSDRGFQRLRQSEPFDLCVVDEAHEVFAGIHRRFDRGGHYLGDSPHARIAGRLKSLLWGQTPVLLLTATPLSNSLAELWGLVHYVDPSGTLLGDLPTFRQMFCADDDRTLVAGQAQDLQRRLRGVVQRTLRRQAQEFLSTPFVERRARLFEYDMTEDEHALYEDVTRYLLTPGLFAFRGPNRQLLLIGFHRRMASSHRALSVSLERVAERLRGLCEGGDVDAVSELLADLEEELVDSESEPVREPEPEPEALDAESIALVAAELQRVELLIERLGALDTDTKARALLDIVVVLGEEARAGRSSGKLVIFTESLATQDYLREFLIASGLLADDEITLFRGQNSSSRAQAALERWEQEVGYALPAEAETPDRPSRDVAMRLALVHEFKQRSRAFISTEAGGKGLNLQFCDTVINYDLPWNPQRIEQRIGRCHRYGQTRDVTVVNFLQRGNRAQRLTLDILSRKLELFGTVLDASDQVLYEAGLGGPSDLSGLVDFGAELRLIYESARSPADIEDGLERLGHSVEKRRAEVQRAQERTHSLIESRLDVEVCQAFVTLARELPWHLGQLDHDCLELLRDYLAGQGIAHRVTGSESDGVLEIGPSERLPEVYREGLNLNLGQRRGAQTGPGLHLGHPLLQLAREAAEVASPQFRVRLRGDVSEPLTELRGRAGRLRLLKLSYPGFEPVDRLVPVVALAPTAGAAESVLGDAERQAVLGLLEGPLEELGPKASGVSEIVLEEAVEEALFIDEREVSQFEQELFERAIRQLERHVEDRILVVKRHRAEVELRLRGAERERAAATGSDARSRAETLLQRGASELEVLEVELRRLQFRQDDGYQQWRRHAHERRYAPPRSEAILDVEFVIG